MTSGFVKTEVVVDAVGEFVRVNGMVNAVIVGLLVQDFGVKVAVREEGNDRAWSRRSS
ncbi:MAG: hypothetical protein M0C28_19685 [Candidatus Moduliflexus flocculans]|nr:hypothetical protein [Candidatus Moduliflexus flocculans]